MKKQRFPPTGWLVWNVKCGLCHHSPTGNGDMCLMMECQIAWYCIFPEAPREPEDNTVVPFTTADLIVGSCFYLQYNQVVVGKNVWSFMQETSSLVYPCRHACTGYIFIFIHIGYSYGMKCIDFLFVLSFPSYLQALCSISMHTSMCAFIHRFSLQRRRGLNTVESHYCWCIVFVWGSAVLPLHTSFIKVRQTN